MKRTTFRVYSDPNCAWIKVPKLILDVYLGHRWRRHFTSFSREKGDFVYLEKGCDTANFDRLIKEAGIQPIYKEGSTCTTRFSRVRTYPPLGCFTPSPSRR